MTLKFKISTLTLMRSALLNIYFSVYLFKIYNMIKSKRLDDDDDDHALKYM